MKKLLVVLCLLGFVGSAMASNAPQMTVGGPGTPIMNGPRDNTCQYGFIDTSIGSGWTWGGPVAPYQQLGIMCTGPMTITGAGAYCEFIPTPGNFDVVVTDARHFGHNQYMVLFFEDIHNGLAHFLHNGVPGFAVLADVAERLDARSVVSQSHLDGEPIDSLHLLAGAVDLAGSG